MNPEASDRPPTPVPSVVSKHAWRSNKENQANLDRAQAKRERKLKRNREIMARNSRG